MDGSGRLPGGKKGLGVSAEVWQLSFFTVSVDSVKMCQLPIFCVSVEPGYSVRCLLWVWQL